MTSKRFSRNDWLDFGLLRLADGGPDALRLQDLCKAAEKTIGSFYHHFKDQPVFFDALMRHWYQRNSIDVIAEIDQIPDAQQQAERLTVVASSMNQAVEVGVRNFAFQNETAAKMVAQVDQTRITYLAGLHQQRLGIDEATALALAKLEYAAFVGTQVIWQGGSLEHGQSMSDLFDELVNGYFKPS